MAEDSEGGGRRVRRASIRIPVVAVAQVSRGGARATLVLEDLSLGGLRVRGDIAPLGAAEGDTVTVRLNGRGEKPFDLVGDALVIRADRNALALEWRTDDPTLAEAVLSILDERKDQAE